MLRLVRLRWDNSPFTASEIKFSRYPLILLLAAPIVFIFLHSSHLLRVNGYPLWLDGAIHLPLMILALLVSFCLFLFDQVEPVPRLRYGIRAMLGLMFGICVLLAVIFRPLGYAVGTIFRVSQKVKVNVVQVTTIGDGISLVCDDGSDYVLKSKEVPEPGPLELGANFYGQIIEAKPVSSH